MDVVGGLGLAVSLLLGVLLALVIDGYTLGRRLQTAVSQNGRLQQKVRQLASGLVRTQRELRATQARARQLNSDLAAAGEQLEQATAENHALQRQVETAATEISTLQGNLSRLDGYVEQLESQKEEWGQKLQTAAAEKDVLSQNLARLGNTLDELRQENQEICQKLALSEVELKHLRQELEEASALAGQVPQLQVENQALAHTVQTAESRGEELKAQVQSLLRQLGETQTLRKQLVGAEDKLRAAAAQVQILQSKLSTVQQVLDYTGKNQLRLIRGIGPAYARRLNEAGIHTLNDLARQSPERLREIVELKKWQAVEPKEWIDEAQALAIKLDGEGFQPATADSQPAIYPSQSAQ